MLKISHILKFAFRRLCKAYYAQDVVPRALLLYLILLELYISLVIIPVLNEEAEAQRG